MAKSGEPDDGLMQRGVSAAMWSALGASARIGLQIVAQVAMARLLGPDTYGLFAISLTIVLFAAMFSDLGLSYSLIQRPQVSDDDIRFVFTWQMLLGGALTALLFMLAAPMSRWFGDSRLEPVLSVLAFSCIVVSFGSTSSMLLRRNLDFKSLNIAVVGSYAAGFLCVGLTLAVLGYGVWALVAANLTQLGLASVLTFRSNRHSLRPLFRHPDWRGILGFGSTVLSTNLLNWLMVSLDRLVIGMTMPVAAAGLYATIGNLMMAPITTINGVLQSALYATTVRAQSDPMRLQKALCAVLAMVVLCAAPVFVAVSITAETLILAIYGEAWAGGSVVLQPMALAMPAMLLMGMSIPTLWASGHTFWEFNLQAPLALLWTAVLFLLGWYGSLAVLSWAMCGWFYMRALVIALAACRAIQLQPAALLAPMRAGVFVTLAVAVAAAAADRLPIPHPLLRLLAIVLCSGGAMLATILAVRSILSADVLALIDRVIERMPSHAGRGLARRLFIRTEAHMS